MNNSRKQCINVPTATYSGKEMSPLRYGISAEEFDVGTVKTGHDGLNWIVKMKNNRKVWVRIYIPCNKMVHEIHKQNQSSICDNDITGKNTTDNDDKKTNERNASNASNDSNASNASDASNASNASNASDINEIDDKKTLDDEIDEEQPMIKDIKKENKNDKNSKNSGKTGEKKLTNYNIFLAYRLNKLKEEYSKTSENKTKKEIFTEVLSEWKNIDKNSQEFKDIMIEAEVFKNNK